MVITDRSRRCGFLKKAAARWDQSQYTIQSYENCLPRVNLQKGRRLKPCESVNRLRTRCGIRNKFSAAGAESKAPKFDLRWLLKVLRECASTCDKLTQLLIVAESFGLPAKRRAT